MLMYRKFTVDCVVEGDDLNHAPTEELVLDVLRSQFDSDILFSVVVLEDGELEL